MTFRILKLSLVICPLMKDFFSGLIIPGALFIIVLFFVLDVEVLSNLSLVVDLHSDCL